MEEPYNYFNDIEDVNLRAFNRLMYCNSLMEDKGLAYAQDYINELDIKARYSMELISQLLLRYGYWEARKIIMSNIEFEEDKQIEFDFGNETNIEINEAS